MGLDLRISQLGDTVVEIERYNWSGTRQKWGQINNHGGQPRQSMINLTHMPTKWYNQQIRILFFTFHERKRRRHLWIAITLKETTSCCLVSTKTPPRIPLGFGKLTRLNGAVFVPFSPSLLAPFLPHEPSYPWWKSIADRSVTGCSAVFLSGWTPLRVGGGTGRIGGNVRS